MLEKFDLVKDTALEDWYLDLSPAQITIYNLKTGRQVQEPSLAAVTCRREELQAPYPGGAPPLRIVPDKLLAVGRAALEYRGAPDTVVFSPFRGGQIAHYQVAQQLIKALLGQIGPKLLLPKPPMWVHIQGQTTQVEKQALSDAAIQSGARAVYLYTDPLSAVLDRASGLKAPQNAVILHIEPQDETSRRRE